MAKRRRKGGVGSFLTVKSSNAPRHYQKVYSSNVTSRQVPKACALRTSGPKKGKLKRGCYFGSNGHVFCDVVKAQKMIDRCKNRKAAGGPRGIGRRRSKKANWGGATRAAARNTRRSTRRRKGP